MRISRTGPKKNKEQGFTLLEMLIVLLIAGFFISVVTLQIEDRIHGGDLRLASRIIIGEIRSLRARAAHTRKPQTLVLDIDANVIEKSVDLDPDSTSRGWALPDQNAKPTGTPLPAGVTLEDVVILSYGKIQEGKARIRFFVNGSMERALIHLSNESEDQYTLEINPMTGEVRVHDRYIEQKMAS